MAEKKARYSKPASQVDLERREKNGNESNLQIVRDAEVPLSTNGYVGVDEIYQTAANNTEVPRKASKGPEAKIFEAALAEDAEYPELNADEDDEDAVKDGGDSGSTSSTTTPPTGSTTPPPSGTSNNS